MRPTIFLALALGLVPLQATALQRVGDLGIPLDACLVAAFLAGFLRGEVEGTVLGLTLGFIQDLFSAGPLWLNTMTKGGLGLCAGLLGRHLAHATPVAVFIMVALLSVASGAIFAVSMRLDDTLAETVAILQNRAVPQALGDASIAALAYWLLPGRRHAKDAFSQEIQLFGR